MRSLVVALVAGFLPAMAPAQAPSAPVQAPPHVVTTGQGETVLAPDFAVLRLGVQARGNTAAAASAQASTRVERLRSAIRARGFPLDSVRVIRFDVAPNYDMERERRLIDYRAGATVQLTVRPLDRLGAVLDTALVAGASEIQSIEFRSDSVEVARDRALSRALQQARADAQTLARAGGGTLGRLLSLNTQGPAMPFERPMMAFAERSAISTPPISGEVVVSVTVQGTWEFVPGTR